MDTFLNWLQSPLSYGVPWDFTSRARRRKLNNDDIRRRTRISERFAAHANERVPSLRERILNSYIPPPPIPIGGFPDENPAILDDIPPPPIPRGGFPDEKPVIIDDIPPPPIPRGGFPDEKSVKTKGKKRAASTPTAYLEDIIKGVKLKPLKPQSSSKKSPLSLIDELKQGKKLKHVEPPVKRSRRDTDETALEEALSTLIPVREEMGNIDEEDGDEWEDEALPPFVIPETAPTITAPISLPAPTTKPVNIAPLFIPSGDVLANRRKKMGYDSDENDSDDDEGWGFRKQKPKSTNLMKRKMAYVRSFRRT